MFQIADSCYVCLPYLEEDRNFTSGLEKIFDQVKIHEGVKRPTKEDLKDIVEKNEAVIIGTQEKMDEAIAEASKNLQAIGTLSSGTYHINSEAFKQRNIEVHSVSQSNTVSVAEHTLGLILALQKRLIQSNKSVLEGEGRKGLTERPAELNKKTVGVVGAGSIAKEVVRKLKPFDVEVKVWTFNPEKHDGMKDTNLELESKLWKLIDSSDIVTIHIPLSAKTEYLISPEILEKVEDGRKRVLINTSRAEIVKESVLANHLGKDCVFNSAGLDVFQENLPEKISSERKIFTPHTAGLTQESSRRMRDELLVKLEN